ncbi:peptidoglycan DD-metalloendopeptidase family protein [Nonomuraea phyllanthi]|uniref:Peptidoglycan DD-metalloendopeptidase family protein n=1 Tax=Nonomuraea phyllanthi TaxID=2219224 RepID=A0A5C4WVA1_9ACTN|nr:peptidoglycan DD-metalloendopeptidase family protein [Nonomuraea phyllanthi]
MSTLTHLHGEPHPPAGPPAHAELRTFADHGRPHFPAHSQLHHGSCIPALPQLPGGPRNSATRDAPSRIGHPHPFGWTKQKLPPLIRRLLKLLGATLAALLLTAATATALLVPATQARASPPTWRWPLDGHPRVLRPFAPPPEPWLAGHRGVDLAAPPSTPVLAAGPGKVRFAGPVGGRGVITVEHEGGLRTTYLPVEASVRKGQPVTSGSRLGIIEASTGHCPESCLHWGLRRGTRYLDPLLLLGQAPIRLLPFWPVNEQAPAPAEENTPGEQTREPSTSPLDKQQAPPPTTPQPQPPPLPQIAAAFPATTNTTPNFLLRSSSTLSTLSTLPIASTASTPSTPAISIAVLLAAALLIIALRLHRRTHTRTRTPRLVRRRGQHRKLHRIRRARKHRASSWP